MKKEKEKEKEKKKEKEKEKEKEKKTFIIKSLAFEMPHPTNAVYIFAG